jgi:hypothetical protein
VGSFVSREGIATPMPNADGVVGDGTGANGGTTGGPRSNQHSVKRKRNELRSVEYLDVSRSRLRWPCCVEITCW